MNVRLCGFGRAWPHCWRCCCRCGGAKGRQNPESKMNRLVAIALVHLALLLAVLLALATGQALAEDYPVRPMRILSPYAPGGISDIAARIVAGKLTEAWGQQVIVENRPGGNG